MLPSLTFKSKILVLHRSIGTKSGAKITLNQQGIVMMLHKSDVLVVGDIVTFKALGQNTQGQYALIEIACNPKVVPPPYIRSREDEAYYMLEGEVEFYLDSETILATPGTFVHSPQRQKYSFKNTGTTIARMLYGITPAGLEMFFAEVGRPVTDSLNPPVPDRVAIDKLVATAPKYGIAILPLKTGK
jgi:mannose-6-phosphate isomerase-like protein (cupin superfamily)